MNSHSQLLNNLNVDGIETIIKLVSLNLLLKWNKTKILQNFQYSNLEPISNLTYDFANFKLNITNRLMTRKEDYEEYCVICQCALCIHSDIHESSSEK